MNWRVAMSSITLKCFIIASDAISTTGELVQRHLKQSQNEAVKCLDFWGQSTHLYFPKALNESNDRVNWILLIVYVMFLAFP